MPSKIPYLKLKAREINRISKPSPYVAALIYVAVAMILGLLSDRLLTSNITESGVKSYMNYFLNGNVEKALEYASRFRPSPSGSLINIVIHLLEQILAAGFSIFILHTVRKDGEACYENLLDGFGIAGKVLLLFVIRMLIVGVLSLLLVFPGIIAAYKYSQSLYILLDHPEYSVIDCMRESKRLMDGRKMERFKLDLSFLGWLILEMFVPLVEIFVLPFMETTGFLYYETITGEDRSAGYYSV